MHKITKSLLMALALACTSLSANALVNLSNPATDVTGDLYDYSSVGVKHDFSLASPALAGKDNNFFIDNYTFTLSESNDLSGLLTSLITTPNSGLAITGFDLLGNGGVVLTGKQKAADNAAEQAWSFGSGAHPLSAGDYTLRVSGYVNGVSGSYSGNIAVSAVPEPETVAMLLAGLGLVGVVSRRRKVAAAA
ncbi:hypothetical protein CSQ96_09285 [Janthinobacterium sp. BJB412]|nr:hypothetical protein CSQ96_09285 [Janthinobacterium sp. BJB412]